jgi:2-dehydro-3-deoxyglucarate aldolase/4-hydroxy-2-oxoheptanedioate aldolase
MVPMVETREQAEFIVSCSRYPPEGRRGAAFGFAHDDYAPGDVTEKIAAAHARTMIMALIETERGAANVDQIAAVAGIDVLWLGHFDLTNFLGVPGQFTHPRYLDAVAAIVAGRQSSPQGGRRAGSGHRMGPRLYGQRLPRHRVWRRSFAVSKALADGIAALRNDPR